MFSEDGPGGADAAVSPGRPVQCRSPVTQTVRGLPSARRAGIRATRDIGHCRKQTCPKKVTSLGGYVGLPTRRPSSMVA